MKKKIFADSIVNLLTLVIGSLLSLVVGWLLIKIVETIVPVSYFWGAIIHLISSEVTICVVLGAVSYYESYTTLDFSVGQRIASFSIAGAVHLALSTLLGFYPFIAGGTRYLAGVINSGERFNSASMIKEIYLWEYLLAFVILFVLELVAVILCGIIGKNNRIANRSKIEGYYENK